MLNPNITYNKFTRKLKSAAKYPVVLKENKIRLIKASKKMKLSAVEEIAGLRVASLLSPSNNSSLNIPFFVKLHSSK
jgi:hypothetical protein